MKKRYVVETVVLGLFLLVCLLSFDMEAQAKNWGETPELKTEVIHERNAEEYRNDASSDRNLIDDGMDSDSNVERKEWGVAGENLEEKTSVDEDMDLEESSGKQRDVRSKGEQEAIGDDPVPDLLKEENSQIDSEKIWTHFDEMKQAFLDLQERNDLARSWIKDCLVNQVTDIFEEWIRDLQDKTLLGMQESWKAAFDLAENHLHLDKRVNEKKNETSHQREDRWFIFDAKNHEESKEKESKKKKVKQVQTRNGKDLETRNKVYVNALLRVRMELVYFACAKEREWIVRRETLF